MFAPLRLRTPITRMRTLPMRMSLPTGDWPSNNSRTIVCPTRHTQAALRTSLSLNGAPSSRFVQLRTTRKSGEVPSNILGTSPDFLVVRNWTNLEEGAPLSDSDVRSAACVCLVGQTIVRELFDGQSPVGKDIRIGSVRMRVIGVLSRKGANMAGRDQDDYILAPWTTVKFRISGSRMSNQPAAASVASGADSLSQI